MNIRESNINPVEGEKNLNLEKKYPQDEKELLLEMGKIWEKIKGNMTPGKTGFDSEITLSIIRGAKIIMEETIEAFSKGDKSIVRHNLNTLRDIDKNISTPKKEVKIPEMELALDERSKIFYDLLEKIKEKSDKFVSFLLDELKKDFESATVSENKDEEKRCWRTLKEFQEADLDKIEKSVSEIKDMLEKPESEEEKEEWE